MAQLGGPVLTVYENSQFTGAGALAKPALIQGAVSAMKAGARRSWLRYGDPAWSTIAR